MANNEHSIFLLRKNPPPKTYTHSHTHNAILEAESCGNKQDALDTFYIWDSEGTCQDLQ